MLPEDDTKKDIIVENLARANTIHEESTDNVDLDETNDNIDGSHHSTDSKEEDITPDPKSEDIQVKTEEMEGTDLSKEFTTTSSANNNPKGSGILIGNSLPVNDGTLKITIPQNTNKAFIEISYNPVYAGAISGFIAGPAIRCLSDYISGENKDKTCLDHYYNTFNPNNLLHVASSAIASSALRALSIATVNKNDYLHNKHPYALGFIHTAGYDLLELTYNLGKTGYNWLSGNSEDYSEF